MSESLLAKAHELLNQATSFIPTDEQIESLTEDQIAPALSKIQRLREMHLSNPDLWHQLDALETKVLAHSYKVRSTKGSSDAQ